MKKRFVFLFILALFFLIALPLFGAYRLKTALPSKVYLSENGSLKINTGSFIFAPKSDNYTKTASEIVLSCPREDSYEIDLNLFGIVPVKTLTVASYDENLYMPSGQAIGIKIFTDGVLVISIEENLPAYDAGIKPGDVITHINGVKVLNSSHFSSLLKKSKADKITINAVRDKVPYSVCLNAINADGDYKIGAWVRDSSAGIGTLTYIKADDLSFGALGHGICDIDTGSLLTLMQGSITDCEIVDTVKGKKGSAGKLCGVLKTGDKGVIEKNSDIGIYGTVKKDIDFSKRQGVLAATRFEVCEGEATILATVNSSVPEEYKIYIEQVNTQDETGGSMVIRVTDDRLIKKTGGIVQGMSGSPILQNGKLVGAVTHVFLNDPTRGYGIFIENMLEEAEKIK